MVYITQMFGCEMGMVLTIKASCSSRLLLDMLDEWKRFKTSTSSDAAVSPNTLCPNTTAGDDGNGENIDIEDGNAELHGNSTIAHTPTVEEYLKHKSTHYRFKAWCPICVKNAAQNKPHYKNKHEMEAESISMDYMFLTEGPTAAEITHPILVIKAKISGRFLGITSFKKRTTYE